MWQQSGFVKSETNIGDAIDQLHALLTAVKNRFQEFSEAALMQRPEPGKWSAKELLGHLIDSAINNLKRFTEIQFLPQPYIINPYQQNELVVVNNYQHLPVAHLLNLWTALNQQVIYVVKNIPEEKLSYPINPQYNNTETKSLAWLICDYVAHIDHHYKQVLPGLS